jgi:hypothetical protein
VARFPARRAGARPSGRIGVGETGSGPWRDALTGHRVTLGPDGIPASNLFGVLPAAVLFRDGIG